MAVFLNDRFLENENAFLHVSDLSIQRGYAVFDFFRTVNSVPLFMADHLNRFFASASALYLPVRKTKEELSAIIDELIKKSSLDETGIRIMLTGGNSADSYHPAEPNLIITCNPVKTTTEQDFEKGISVITYKHQRELPHVKSINYLTGVWLQPLLKEKKSDDVLYYNNESITEFPRSNVFIVTNKDVLVTPAKNTLKGITRKYILSLATEFIQVKEKDITLDELMNASEVFLTSTTKKILPVVKIDGKIIRDGRPGKFTNLLYQKFLELEKGVATDCTD